MVTGADTLSHQSPPAKSRTLWFTTLQREVRGSQSSLVYYNTTVVSYINEQWETASKSLCELVAQVHQ